MSSQYPAVIGAGVHDLSEHPANSHDLEHQGDREAYNRCGGSICGQYSHNHSMHFVALAESEATIGLGICVVSFLVMLPSLRQLA